MTSIKKEITIGVFWIAVAKYSGIVISLVITAILARNIPPSAFGTMTIATILMAFLDIFTDMGIGPAIIQFKDLSRHQINSLFMIGSATGLALSLGLFFLSPQISHFYNDPILIDVCHLISICLFFNSLNVVPNGLMLKAKRFKTIAIRTLSFQIICGSLAVFAALKGWGIYALMITPIVSSVGIFLVNFYNYPQQIIFKIDTKALKTVWSFSSFQFLFSVINYFSRNLDKLIIGKYFSMAQLGYYDKAYRLMQMPLQNITFVISPVLHPILSSLQDDKYELGIKNCKLLKFMSQLSFPVGILLYFCAPEIITILFGNNWQPSIPIFKILAISLPLQILLSTSGSLFQAAGRTNHLFLSGLSNTFITVIGFLIAALQFKTIQSIAWAWDITLCINFFTTYILMNKLTFQFSFTQFIKTFLPQTVNSLITIIIVQLILNILSIDNMFSLLIVKTCLVILPTFLLAYFLNQYNILYVIRNSYNKMRTDNAH